MILTILILTILGYGSLFIQGCLNRRRYPPLRHTYYKRQSHHQALEALAHTFHHQPAIKSNMTTSSNGGLLSNENQQMAYQSIGQGATVDDDEKKRLLPVATGVAMMENGHSSGHMNKPSLHHHKRPRSCYCYLGVLYVSGWFITGNTLIGIGEHSGS